jgi:hypothetical protein
LKYGQTVKKRFVQANERTQYFLWRGKNVLVAGIDLKKLNPKADNSASGKKNLVDIVPAGWKGELRAPDGTLILSYRHKDSIQCRYNAQTNITSTTEK